MQQARNRILESLKSAMLKPFRFKVNFESLFPRLLKAASSVRTVPIRHFAFLFHWTAAAAMSVRWRDCAPRPSVTHSFSSLHFSWVECGDPPTTTETTTPEENSRKTWSFDLKSGFFFSADQDQVKTGKFLGCASSDVFSLWSTKKYLQTSLLWVRKK